MNQNLSSYWIFYTVANAGNISKAAKELYISQPAISKSIQKLEMSLNCKLFSRSSRGVVLTEEGALLYSHVRDAFESLSLGEDKLKLSIALGVGHLQIGVSATLCKHLLMPYLKEFIRRKPHISLSIKCQSTNETLRLLDENKIDIGLIGRPESLKGIRFHYLEQIEDIFVANSDYISNLKKRGIPQSGLLENSTLMLLDKNNMTRRYIDDYLQENHITVAESIDVSNMELLIDFAKIGVGVACVIKSFVLDALQEKSLIQIPLKTPIHTREVGFAYRENEKPSKSLQAFIDFFNEYQPKEVTHERTASHHSNL
ncbi:MAG: LysR family transcriptional regulator [Blautia sp.]|nr:LysR family transcriptional regulator [Blautia sp.]